METRIADYLDFLGDLGAANARNLPCMKMARSNRYHKFTVQIEFPFARGSVVHF